MGVNALHTYFTHSTEGVDYFEVPTGESLENKILVALAWLEVYYPLPSPAAIDKSLCKSFSREAPKWVAWFAANGRRKTMLQIHATDENAVVMAAEFGVLKEILESYPRCR